MRITSTPSLKDLPKRKNPAKNLSDIFEYLRAQGFEPELTLNVDPNIRDTDTRQGVQREYVGPTVYRWTIEATRKPKPPTKKELAKREREKRRVERNRKELKALHDAGKCDTFCDFCVYHPSLD